MKICALGFDTINVGKHSVKDTRLDEVDKLVKAKKKTYVQVEVIAEAAIFEADGVLVSADSKADLILRDLEFVETRLSRCGEEEKAILNKLKAVLEKEEFVSSLSLTEDEKKAIASYSLITARPVIVAKKEEAENSNELLARALRESGYISFFTAGEKETRAWLIKKGTNAWEAAGAIHSDIQQGFIRAEIISYQDYIEAGGESRAKQAGKQRLEQKDYVMQDADLTVIRCNK